MDINALMQALAGQAGTAQTNAKSFSDMLRERRQFVQGAENQTADVTSQALQNGGEGGVRISSQDATSPLFNFHTDNANKTAQLTQESFGYQNQATDVLKSLAAIAQQQQGQNLQNQQLQLQKHASDREDFQAGFGASGSQGAMGLLKLRETFQKAGIPTKQIDDQLRAAGVNPGVDPATATAQQTVGLIDELMGRDTKKITGTVGGVVPFLNVHTSEGRTTQAKRDQLISLLSLNARQMIKGTGAISDKETKMLEQSVAALKPGMSDQDFRKELKKIRGVVSKNAGLDDSTGNQGVNGYTIKEVK